MPAVTPSGSSRQTTIAAFAAAGDAGDGSVTGQTVEVAADATLDASATGAVGSGGTIGVIADTAREP